jgi:hypothetical protein
MVSLRAKMVGGSLFGLILLGAGLALLRGQHEGTPRPAPPQVAPERTPPAPAATPAPSPSRSKGEREWSFFFRTGDTLSRMSDGGTLGVVVRLERVHRFADGSAGPAYVVRSADQRETTFDADELERSARVEAIREMGRPGVGDPPR